MGVPRRTTNRVVYILGDKSNVQMFTAAILPVSRALFGSLVLVILGNFDY